MPTALSKANSCVEEGGGGVEGGNLTAIQPGPTLIFQELCCQEPCKV